MGNLLYLVAVVLIIIWAIGFLGYHATGLIRCSGGLAPCLRRLGKRPDEILFQDLAIGVQRQLSHDDQCTRQLVIGNMLAAEGQDLFRGSSRAGAQRYRSGDVRHIVADPARAAEVLNFRAAVSPSDGLREFAFAPLR